MDIFGMPGSAPAPTDYQTREEYLNAFIEAARPHFERVNAPLPPNVRVSVGFTSRGYKAKSIGECWSDTASEDGHYEIFIKPTLDGVARICDVLTHELIHCAVGLDKGHGPYYRRVAVSLGLSGPMRATQAGEEWYKWALPIIEQLGPMPYGTLNGGQSSAKKKQATALYKLQCTTCGWLSRVTRKHILPHPTLNCPVPSCVGVLICDDLSGDTGDGEGDDA